MWLDCNLLGCAEHGATAERSRKRVVASRGVVDSDAARQVCHIDGVALWLVLKTAGEATDKPCGCWPENWEPEHLDVRVINCITVVFHECVFPGNDMDDGVFGGVAGMHGCLLLSVCGRCVRLRKNGGDVQRRSARRTC